MYDSSRLKHANNRPASRQRRWSDCLRAEPFADTRRERETVWTESWCLTPALLWSGQVSLWRFQETSGCQCLSVHSQNVIMLLVDDWARVPENLSTCCGTEIASPHPGFRVFSVFFHDHFKCFPLKNDRQHTHTHTYRRILVLRWTQRPTAAMCVPNGQSRGHESLENVYRQTWNRFLYSVWLTLSEDIVISEAHPEST